VITFQDPLIPESGATSALTDSVHIHKVTGAISYHGNDDVYELMREVAEENKELTQLIHVESQGN